MSEGETGATVGFFMLPKLLQRSNDFQWTLTTENQRELMSSFAIHGRTK
jgi:hypothetical protein